MENHNEPIYLYPVWIRLWHVLNAVLCLLLIITGLSIQFSNPTITVRFNVAVAIHNVAGVLLSFNYILFFIGNLFTKNGGYYVIEVKGFFKRLMIQFHHYTIGVFKKEPAPFPVTAESKFNPLQQFSYVAVMYTIIPLAIISGLGLLYPDLTVNGLIGISGLDYTDLLHLFCGFIITIFMCVHLYFCTFGKTAFSNFKSIFNGYH
ncbi:MAG: cytochrome b/b6 domain-containing protein [Bacteroidota bacterium]|jgi:thiosulfate reductase cytochrome b subunit